MNFENRFTNKKVCKNSVYIDKGDNPKSVTLNSGKIIDFLQAFTPHLSFSYYFMLVLGILNILYLNFVFFFLFFFSGK